MTFISNLYEYPCIVLGHGTSRPSRPSWKSNKESHSCKQTQITIFEKVFDDGMVRDLDVQRRTLTHLNYIMQRVRNRVHCMPMT